MRVVVTWILFFLLRDYPSNGCHFHQILIYQIETSITVTVCSISVCLFFRWHQSLSLFFVSLVHFQMLKLSQCRCFLCRCSNTYDNTEPCQIQNSYSTKSISRKSSKRVRLIFTFFDFSTTTESLSYEYCVRNPKINQPINKKKKTSISHSQLYIHTPTT